MSNPAKVTSCSWTKKTDASIGTRRQRMIGRKEGEDNQSREHGMLVDGWMMERRSSWHHELC